MPTNYENKIFYYFGEFGRFNLSIIGLFELFFSKFPHSNIKFTTYENYKKILSIKFKKNITFINMCNYSLSRNRHFSPYMEKKINESEESNYMNIIYFFQNIIIKNNINNLLSFDHKFFYVPIKNRLKFGNLKKNKNEKEKIICIFPRNRIQDKDDSNSNFNTCRNVNTKNIINIIKYIQSNFSSYKIYILGHEKEIIKLNYEKYNIFREDDILKSITILNNCDLLLSPCSGYIDFAKNCGVKNIILLYRNLIEIEKNKLKTEQVKKYTNCVDYHLYNNPFETCYFNYVDEYNFEYNITSIIKNININNNLNYLHYFHYHENKIVKRCQRYLEMSEKKINYKFKNFTIIGNYLNVVQKNSDEIILCIKKKFLENFNKKKYKSSGISLTVLKFIKTCNIFFEILSDKCIDLELRYYDGKTWNKIENIKKSEDKKYFTINFTFNNFKGISPTRISFDNIKDCILTIKNINVKPL